MDNYQNYFSKIRSFYEKNKRMPSYSEILKITGLKSKNAVFQIVQKLEDAGLVIKDSAGKLIPGSGLAASDCSVMWRPDSRRRPKSN